MPLVQAWECPRTSKLFHDKASYISHLKIEARINIQKRKQAQYKAGKAAFWRTKMRETVADFTELKQFILDNWEMFCRNAHDGNVFGREKPFDYSMWAKPEEIKIFLKRNEHVSNSHNCPLNGGVTNFSAKDDRPTGYPGWKGDIEFKWDFNGIPKKMIPKMITELPSNYFAGTGLCTGSGSGGQSGAWQELYLFEIDWSMLKSISDQNTLARYLAAGNNAKEYTF